MGKSTISRINEVLERECDIYEDILDLSKAKKEAIISGKISELEKLLEIEQTLLIKAGKIGRERENLAEAFAEEKGIDRDDINISVIVNSIKDDETARLEKTREKFLGILNDLDSNNKINSSLINNSIEYINFSINLLNSMEAGSGGYGKSGKIIEGEGKNFLDVRL